MISGINKIRGIVLIVAASLALASCGEEDGHITLKMGHSLDTGHSVHQGMLYMAERLRDISGGQMDIDVYPSAQLGTEKDMMELLQIGSLAITKVSTSPMESFVPKMKVFSIPYVFRDEEHLWKVLDGPIGQDMLDAGSSVHLQGLAYYSSGSRSFYANKPIYTPEDLKGLKIRVQNSPTSVRMVEALGGSATPIAFGELYTALQQGVVDGAENNPPSFYLSKHYDVSRYYTLDMHTSVPDIILMSGHIWDKLSKQQQEWLREAARQSVPYQKELWDKSTAEALQAVIDAGVTVIEPDKSAFQDAVKDMHESYKGQPVYDLMQEIAEIK